MTDRTEKAVAYKHNGNNCCQAVLMAFADELDISPDALRKMGADDPNPIRPGSMGAAEMLLGLKQFQGRPVLGTARQIHQDFTQKSGASICKDLKGIETGTVLCSCDDCVRNAVESAEKYIFN